MSKPKILISGAGIAGPAVAFWLVRSGFDVTIVERAAALRHAGNGVDIRAEALSVISRMGLSGAVRDRAVHTQGLRFVDARDRERARVSTAGLEKWSDRKTSRSRVATSPRCFTTPPLTMLSMFSAMPSRNSTRMPTGST